MIAVNNHWWKSGKLLGASSKFCASSLGVANAIISFPFSYTHTCGRGAAPDGELPRAVVIVVIVLIAPGDRNYLNNAPSTPTTCEPLTHDP